ncbi:MAG: hypothetical protein WBN03_21355 [Desulfobacterales bacterium]
MALDACSRWVALATVFTIMSANPAHIEAQPEALTAKQSFAASIIPENQAAGSDHTTEEPGGDRHLRLSAAAAVPPAHSAAAVGKTGRGDSVAAAETRWQWSLNAGYRQDDFEWSFTLPGINPRSELTWRDVESFQLEFGLQRRFFKDFRLKGAFAYAFIFDGQNQDSDYDGNNRTLEFSRSNNATDAGDLWDISLGLAYDIRLFSDRFLLSPLLGYAFNDQNLQISDGVQTLPPLGPFQGLDSSYDATWYGPWVGMELQYNSYGSSAPSPGYEAFFGFEYHLADFEARADWNLRPDLAHPKSFEQDADGSGWVFTGAFNYLFNSRWGVNLTGKYQHWETDTGTHRFFFSDGSSFATRLDEVIWKSFAVTLGVTCRF